MAQTSGEEIRFDTWIMELQDEREDKSFQAIGLSQESDREELLHDLLLGERAPLQTAEALPPLRRLDLPVPWRLEREAVDRDATAAGEPPRRRVRRLRIALPFLPILSVSFFDNVYRRI